MVQHNRTECRSHCPIAFALDIVGDKWSLLIVRDIMFMGKRTYGEFLESEEKIATNILAQRLAWLERKQIIEKTPDPTNRRRLFYRLTPRGMDLAPALLEIILWSAQYDPQTAAPRPFVERIRKSKKALIRRIMSGKPLFANLPQTKE